MDSSDSIDKSWDTTSDTTTTAMRSDPMASENSPVPPSSGWMVNVAGRDIVELSHVDVISKVQSGELNGSMLVWREGMENWAKLESVPAFQSALTLDSREPEEPTTAGRNFFPIYERPAPTLVFDEGVEEEWKGTPKAPEPSKTARGNEPSKSTRSASARPPAPSLPPLAPRRSPVVPADEAPPPPPLPPRKKSAPPRLSDKPETTIPGGLAAPTPPSPGVAPGRSGTSTASGAVKGSSPPATATVAKRSSSPAAAVTSPKSPLPQATGSSSPLLAAIAAAASNPEPIVAAAAPVPAAVIPDETSVIARFNAMRSVSLRNAALACAASALVASLVTGLVVGSGSEQAERRPPEPSKKVATLATVAPSPPPPVPAPAPVAPPPAAPEPAKVEKVTASEPEAEKPKPKPVKISSYKPPKVAALPSETGTGEAEKPAPNPERDDPVRAVPDRVDDRSATESTTWQADPGF